MHFAGGPGTPKDWIAVYPGGACNPTCPSGSTLWKYCATDSRTATGAMVTSGAVTIDQDADYSGKWPLIPGSYDMVYLANDGYSPLAIIGFQVEGTNCPSGNDCHSDSDCHCGATCQAINSSDHICTVACATDGDCADYVNPDGPHTHCVNDAYGSFCQ